MYMDSFLCPPSFCMHVVWFCMYYYFSCLIETVSNGISHHITQGSEWLRCLSQRSSNSCLCDILKWFSVFINYPYCYLLLNLPFSPLHPNCNNYTCNYYCTWADYQMKMLERVERMRVLTCTCIYGRERNYRCLW